MNSVSKRSENLLSVILLSYNSSIRIKDVYDKVAQLLEDKEIPFELLIIDDGSEDNSYQIASDLEKVKSNVRAFQLSKNYTSFYAMFAGLSVCRGDCAIIIPDDEQLPYQVIVSAYQFWQEGNKIIIPQRTNRNDGIINDLFANSFYRIINFLSDVKFPKGGADTFLIDREIIEIINSRIHPIKTSIIAEILRLGFSPVFLPYERSSGINNRSRWTERQRINYFKDTLFSNSSCPIRVIKTMGFCFSGISFLAILIYIFKIITGRPVIMESIPYWAPTAIIISFFSGLILYSLGIIAEYTWRIYEEVKNRPGYIIKNKEKEDQNLE